MAMGKVEKVEGGQTAWEGGPCGFDPVPSWSGEAWGRPGGAPLRGALQSTGPAGATLHCEQPRTTEPELWGAMNGSIEFDDIMRDLLTKHLQQQMPSADELAVRRELLSPGLPALPLSTSAPFGPPNSLPLLQHPGGEPWLVARRSLYHVRTIAACLLSEMKEMNEQSTYVWWLQEDDCPSSLINSAHGITTQLQQVPVSPSSDTSPFLAPLVATPLSNAAAIARQQRASRDNLKRSKRRRFIEDSAKSGAMSSPTDSTLNTSQVDAVVPAVKVEDSTEVGSPGTSVAKIPAVAKVKEERKKKRLLRNRVSAQLARERKRTREQAPVTTAVMAGGLYSIHHLMVDHFLFLQAMEEQCRRVEIANEILEKQIYDLTQENESLRLLVKANMRGTALPSYPVEPSPSSYLPSSSISLAFGALYPTDSQQLMD
eukprot:SM000030S11342  [mRNA]  locus=s30:215880:219416:+ [translate_table: standard]